MHSTFSPSRPGSSALERASALGLALALAFPAAAQAGGFPITGDFDGDGSFDAAYYDPASASLEVGFDLAGPSPLWHAVDLRQFPYIDSAFLRSADLDDDGRDDLFTAGRNANRVLVLWGQANQAVAFRAAEFTVGAGPILADALPGSGDRTLALPLVASAQPSLHRFQPAAPENPHTSDAIEASFAAAGWHDFRAGRDNARAILNPAQFFAAALRPADEAARLQVFQKRLLGALTSAHSPLAPGHHRLTEFGLFLGAAADPAVVSFGPGAKDLTVFTVTPGAAGNPPTLAAQTHPHGPVADARKLTTPAGDRLLVVPAGPGPATIYDLTGGALTLEQSIAPPAGRQFAALVPGPGPGPDDDLLIGGFTDSDNYEIYRDSGAGYQSLRRGSLPAPLTPASGTQIALYDRHPFGASPPLLLEGFPAAHWARTPAIAGSNIHATREWFVDSATGLGDPMPVTLGTTVSFPATAQVLANQIDLDTSTSFDGVPGADGPAAVVAVPPGGTYASTVAVSILTSPGVTVHYRLGNGPWSTAAGDVHLARPGLTTLEFMGEAPGGVLSAIHSESYLITQRDDTDTDGDKVPDAVELAAGLSPLAGNDTDGDGISDFSELVEGTDPNDPTDTPAGEVALDVRRLSVTVRAPTSGGGFANPGLGTELRVAALDGTQLAVARTTQTGAPQLVFDLESPPRWVVVETPSVFPLANLFGFFPQGRHLAAVVEIPGKPVPTGPVNPDSADLLGDWLAGLQASIAAAQAETIEVTLDPDSTLLALAFEAWLAQRLADMDRLAPGEESPRIIGNPRPGIRHLVSAEDLAAIESPDEDNLVHLLPSIWSDLLDAANNADESLFQTIHQIYRTAAGLDPEVHGTDSAPLTVIRSLLESQSVPVPYQDDLAAQPGELAGHWVQIVVSPTPVPFLQTVGTLQSSGTDCLLLVDANDGTRYELLDSAGDPYWQTENAPILDGAGATLEAFLLDLPPRCGELVVMVSALVVTEVPVEPAADQNGNDVPDPYELLLLGGAGGFWDDPDGDGFSTAEELFLDPANPTDPANPASFPAGSSALPAAVTSGPSEAGGHFTLQWDGNPAATYVVETATTLNGDWTPSPVPPVENPPGHFSWQDPDLLADYERKFYRIATSLGL